MAHQVETDALRLLRCINDTQAQGRHGASVDPPRAAQDIGLEVGPELYHDARGYLAEEGALLGDEHTRCTPRRWRDLRASLLRVIPLYRAGDGPL